MNTMAMTLENSLVANNAMTDVIGATFNAVDQGINTLMCSDCCGSNGNSCNPNEEVQQ